MISKLIVHGKDRSEAIARMIRAIDDYNIVGVETTLEFCKFVLKHEAFVSGQFDTGFIGKHFKPEMLSEPSPGGSEVAAIAAALAFAGRKRLNGTATAVKKSEWKRARLG